MTDDSERENQPEEDPSVAARLHRLSDHYNTTGVRRGVEAVMVVMVCLPFNCIVQLQPIPSSSLLLIQL
jgi:hypothetical protein